MTLNRKLYLLIPGENHDDAQRAANEIEAILDDAMIKFSDWYHRYKLEWHFDRSIELGEYCVEHPPPVQDAIKIFKTQTYNTIEDS